MLDQLQDIGNRYGYSFGYGQLEDLITLAQTFTGDEPNPFILFHEGYFLADWNDDAQGALEERHRLIIDICTDSKFTDQPEKRREHLAALKVEAQRVYKSLKKYGEVLSTRAEMGLNLTPRNLDAIKLTITLKTPAVSLCKL